MGKKSLEKLEISMLAETLKVRAILFVCSSYFETTLKKIELAGSESYNLNNISAYFVDLKIIIIKRSRIYLYKFSPV